MSNITVAKNKIPIIIFSFDIIDFRLIIADLENIQTTNIENYYFIIYDNEIRKPVFEQFVLCYYEINKIVLEYTFVPLCNTELILDSCIDKKLNAILEECKFGFTQSPFIIFFCMTLKFYKKNTLNTKFIKKIQLEYLNRRNHDWSLNKDEDSGCETKKIARTIQYPEQNDDNIKVFCDTYNPKNDIF